MVLKLISKCIIWNVMRNHFEICSWRSCLGWDNIGSGKLVPYGNKPLLDSMLNQVYNAYGVTSHKEFNMTVTLCSVRNKSGKVYQPMKMNCEPSHWNIMLESYQHHFYRLLTDSETLYCLACRTTLVATRFRVAVICPIIQVPHCIRVFFYFVWFVFINHIFQFYHELYTYCNILDIYLS